MIETLSTLRCEHCRRVVQPHQPGHYVGGRAFHAKCYPAWQRIRPRWPRVKAPAK